MSAAVANLLVVAWLAVFVPPFTAFDAVAIVLCLACLCYEMHRTTERLK